MLTLFVKESTKIQELVLAANRGMNSIMEEFAAMLRIIFSLPHANPSFHNIAWPKDLIFTIVFNASPATFYSTVSSDAALSHDNALY